jgi:protein-tyrosine phosphatase
VKRWWGRTVPASTHELAVLMVCMGNICRSPTAEGVLRARLQAAGLADAVHVDSAGTHGYHVGDPPDARAQRHARARGLDLSSQRARRVGASDFDRFQLILAMDEDNLAELERLRPDGHPNRPRLLLEFAPRHAAVREVPDPYFGGPDGFDRVLDLVEDACDGLLAHLRQRLAEPPRPPPGADDDGPQDDA